MPKERAYVKWLDEECQVVSLLSGMVLKKYPNNALGQLNSFNYAHQRNNKPDKDIITHRIIETLTRKGKKNKIPENFAPQSETVLTRIEDLTTKTEK